MKGTALVVGDGSMARMALKEVSPILLPSGLHDGHARPLVAMPMEKVDTICLVSRVGTQRDSSVPARELYRSDWFLKARTCVELVGACWFILSAEYGLVHPDEMIEP